MRRAKLSPPASCIDDVVMLPLLSLLEDTADKDVTGLVARDGVGNGCRLGDDVGNRPPTLLPLLLQPLVPLAPFFLQWLPLHFDCADDDGS